MGIAKADGSSHELNPAADRVIGQDEVLLLLAEDANMKIQPYAGPLHPSQIPAIDSSAQKPVEHLLMLGWNPKIYPIMKEFDDYVAEGSTLTLVNSLPTHERQELIKENVGELGTIQVRHLEGEFSSRALMEELQPQNYPNVMVLGDAISAKSAEEADTRAIIALLLLRDMRRRSSLAPNQRVCSEILDPKNRELAATTQINDIVISNEMVSMVLAQITYEPRVQAVLEDLLRSEGTEIYLKPLELYVPAGPAGDLRVPDARGQGPRRGRVWRAEPSSPTRRRATATASAPPPAPPIAPTPPLAPAPPFELSSSIFDRPSPPP